MDRMKRLIEAIGMLMEGEFSGHVKINFSQGSIGRIEKHEELRDGVITLAGKQNSKKKKEKKDVDHDHA